MFQKWARVVPWLKSVHILGATIRRHLLPKMQIRQMNNNWRDVRRDRSSGSLLMLPNQATQIFTDVFCVRFPEPEGTK